MMNDAPKALFLSARIGLPDVLAEAAEGDPSVQNDGLLVLAAALEGDLSVQNDAPKALFLSARIGLPD
eukprot:scaffold3867_cov150-Ochromonas_danica.AAC.1